MVMMEEGDDQERPPATLRIPNVKSVLSVLHAVRNKASGKHQLCTLLLGSDGLSVRWEDDSKALQSSVHLNPNVFSDFRCQDPRRVVGISLTALMDIMAVFSSSTAELEVMSSGAPHRLSTPPPLPPFPKLGANARVCLAICTSLGAQSLNAIMRLVPSRR